VAPTSTRRPGPSAWIASAFASVAPEQNTTSAGRAENRAATASRASSSTRRAARPAWWIEAGLPSASAADAAARAAGRTGSDALASR
jgi:hypothetical protein